MPDSRHALRRSLPIGTVFGFDTRPALPLKSSWMVWWIDVRDSPKFSSASSS